MSARRTATFALVIAETLADAKDELDPAEYDALLEHLVGLIAEVWATQVVGAGERA